MSIDFKTYLTPSIPKEIFQILSTYLEDKCNIKVNLIFETISSGPKYNNMIEEDLSFMCSPPYYWLCDKFNDQIELVPYAPIFNDMRNNDEPLYFSDILVNKNSDIQCLDDLNGHTWAYNDTESLSGYFCIRDYMNKIKMICSGDHLTSIKMVENNKVDITCIDSNVLLFTKHNLKLIGTFGPHPVQPCVINKKCKYKDLIINAFEEINDSYILDELKKYNISKFGKVDEDFYFNKYSIKDKLTKIENFSGLNI